MSNRRQYNELMGQRAQHLAAAQEALNKGDHNGYQDAMSKVKALNPQIEDLDAIIQEESRFAREHAPKFGASPKDMEEMGKALMAHTAVRFNVAEVMQSMGIGIQRNATTIGTGSLVEPVGAGSNIRNGFASQVSSLVDQVNAVDLTGLSGIEEPYVVSEMEAQGGEPAAVSGTARTATDPQFAKAVIRPYEVTTTSYVDRNLSSLNPANYAAKVQEMAIRALRRKANELIALGDGAASPVMFGITTAKNSEGTVIYNTIPLGAAIAADTLDKLVFGYGGDEEVGGNARLLLSKANLQGIGSLRGTNELQRLYKITPDAGNPNTGVITDGGLIVPYTICSAMGARTLAYGDPFNYELGLFGDYVIRVDESVKAVERMHTILGDVMLGGNLTVHHGFSIGTLSA